MARKPIHYTDGEKGLWLHTKCGRAIVRSSKMIVTTVPTRVTCVKCKEAMG